MITSSIMYIYGIYFDNNNVCLYSVELLMSYVAFTT